MSRIHEALKKAAREKSTQPAVGWEKDFREIAAEVEAPSIAEASVAQSNGLVRTTHNRGRDICLNYEAIIKHCARREWQIDPANSVFHSPTGLDGGAERFRTLRSRLYQASATRTLRRVLITSSLAGEGKTFIAANLAQSIVQQPGRRVLLIDADLRAPTLHAVFGAPIRPGLTEYLRGEADECEVIQKDNETDLCLIAAGGQVSNPSELLLSEKMRRLLDSITNVFSWILVDSPPTLPVHDAPDLASLTDGVLLVVRAGATHVAAAEKAAAEFKKKNLLGIVLNQVKKSDTYGEYQYTDSNRSGPLEPHHAENVQDAAGQGRVR